MASRNVISMMVEKGAPFSLDELQQMEDRECWKWVYKYQPPKVRHNRDNRPEICFTGFRPEERQELEQIADTAGYKVVKSVTVKLSILVAGEAPGPTKLEKAHDQRATILNRDEFISAIT